MGKLNLAEVIVDNELYSDTSSFMHPKAPEVFYMNLVPALKMTNTVLSVPSIVIDELENTHKILNSDAKSERAGYGLGIVDTLRRNKLINIIISPGYDVADRFFLTEFLAKSNNAQMSLLTQDVNLAKDITHLSDDIKSVDTGNISGSLKIAANGEIQIWNFSKIEVQCEYCGKDFQVNHKLHEKLAENNSVYTYCHDCLQNLSKNGKDITCEDCNETFTFTVLQQRQYAAKGYSQPKRCKKCNQKRKTISLCQSKTDNVIRIRVA